MKTRRLTMLFLTWLTLSFAAPVMADLRPVPRTAQVAEGTSIAEVKTRKRAVRKGRKKKRPGAARNKPSTAGFFEFIAPILVFNSLLIVAFLHRRRRVNHASPTVRARGKGRNIHFAGPRTLKVEVQADPATMTDDDLVTGAIVPLNQADRTEADDMTQAHMAQGKQLEVKDLTSAGLRLKKPKLKEASQSAAPDPQAELRLPGELGDRFSPIAGERLLTDTQFQAFGETEGTLGVTNRRLLVVHRQTYARWTPPFVYTEDRQHKVSLSQISDITIGNGYRLPFLWPGLALSWWFPIGTVVSLLSIGAYFALPRKVLEVTTGETIRRYPIRTDELDRIYNTLSRASAERHARKKKAAS